MAVRWIRRLHLTRGDKVLIGMLMLASVVSGVLLSHLLSPGSVAVMEVEGQEIERLDLSIDCHRTLVGPLGDTLIEVRDGRVRVVRSACPHQICVRTGWIERAGQMVVCVPNRVVIRVEGEGDMDAVTW